MSPELSTVIGGQLSRFDLAPLETPGLPSFMELVKKAAAGQLDLSPPSVLNGILNVIFGELALNTKIMRQLLIVAILGALLKCLSDAFKHKSAGELGFCVTYIMTVLLAFSSFQLSIGILTELVASVSSMMEASVPLMVSLMAMSGNVAGAAAFHPMLFLALSLINRFITDIFIPVLIAAAALTAVNHLTEAHTLTKLCELIKKSANTALKGIVFLFATLITLQKISAPIINNIALRTAKSAAGAVPVVGGALSSAMDTVLLYASSAKSGVLVALVIVFCAAVAAPLIKMLVIMFIFKLTAALAQPISDERFVTCLDQLGTYIAILTGAGALVAVMCVYTVVILLSF